MSIDRYLAVVHPIKSTRWRKPRIAKFINMTVWGVSLLVILPTMIFSGLDKVPVCGIVWPEPQDVYYKAFIFYTFFIGFFLPLAVICLCYLLIIVKVRGLPVLGLPTCQSVSVKWVNFMSWPSVTLPTAGVGVIASQSLRNFQQPISPL